MIESCVVISNSFFYSIFIKTLSYLVGVVLNRYFKLFELIGKDCKQKCLINDNLEQIKMIQQ